MMMHIFCALRTLLAVPDHLPSFLLLYNLFLMFSVPRQYVCCSCSSFFRKLFDLVQLPYST